MKEKYGFFSNLRYVIRGMNSGKEGLLGIQLLGTAAETISLFIIPMMVKLIIDSLTAGEEIKKTLILIGISSFVMLIVYLTAGYVENNTPYKMKHALIRFKRELTETMVSMEYSNMENP